MKTRILLDHEPDARYMYQRAYSSTRSKRATMERLMEDRAEEREERGKG